MLGRKPCQTNASRSGSWSRVSTPSSSNRQSSTPSATSLNSAKLVPLPSYVAPRGYANPGQIFIQGRLTGVSEHGSDALAWRLLEPPADETNLGTGAECRAYEHLVRGRGPWLLHPEVEQLLRGQRQVGRVRAEEQCRVPIPGVREDQRADLRHPQRADSVGETVGGAVILAALLGELLQQLQRRARHLLTEHLRDAPGDDVVGPVEVPSAALDRHEGVLQRRGQVLGEQLQRHGVAGRDDAACRDVGGDA